MKNLIKNIIYLFIVLLISIPLQAQKESEKAEALDQLFNYAFQNGMFNGSVALVHKGSLIYKKSFGHNGKGQPLNEDSQFLLASLSKQFTAVGIMLLQQDQQLRYDDLVTAYIKNFPYPQITIRHLLNQISGLPEYTDIINSKIDHLRKEYETNGEIITNDHVIQLLNKTKMPLKFNVGEQFDYSNTNYVLLAKIIEKTSGLSYSKYMSEKVFKPLQMTNTYVYDPEKHRQSAQRAYGFKKDLDQKTLLDNDVLPFFNTVGDGGIYSTINDMQKWTKAIAANVFFKSELLDEALTNAILNNGKVSPYGFGWFVRQLPFNKNKVLTHSGEFVGFSNSFFLDVTNNSSLIMLSNNSSSYRPALNSAMVRILYGIPYETPKINSDEIVSEIIFEQGLDEAISWYKKERKTDSNTYNFKEHHLNNLGYDLQKKSRINDAIEILELNAAYYSNSANVYDSLGEMYLTNGEHNKALINYKKALVLDPENKIAAAIIKKLQK